jgi:hypothetical protein
MIMHKVGVKAATVASPDPRIMAAFEVLGYTAEEKNAFAAANMGKQPAEVLAELNAEIDRRNEGEQ